MNFFIKVLVNIRSFLQGIVAFGFNKIRDPDTGRMPFSNRTAKAAGFIILGSLVGYGLISSFLKKDVGTSGIDKFTKEIRQDGGIAARPMSPDIFRSDPRDGGKIDYMSTDIESTADTEEKPSSMECGDLVQKLKDGSPLTIVENKKLDQCLKDNIADLSPEDLSKAKELRNPKLSAKEKEAIRKNWDNPDSNNLNFPNIAAILPSFDPVKAANVVKEAKKIGNNLPTEKVYDVGKEAEKTGPKAVEAVQKASEGESLDKEREKIFKKVVETVNPKEPSLLDGIKMPSFGAGSSGKEDELRDLIKQAKDEAEKSKNINDELADEQAKGADAAKKLADGKKLTESEAQALENVVRLTKEKEASDQKIAELYSKIKDITDELKSIISDANQITEELPSGVFEVSIDGERQVGGKPSDKKTKPRKSGEASKSPPVKKLSLSEKKAIQLKELEGDLLGGIHIGKKLANNQAQKEPFDAKKLVTSFLGDETFCLSAGQRFLASLASEVMFESGKNQQVRIRAEMDIYDSCTQKIVIPKGSIFVANAGSFSEETGIMDLSISSIRINKKTLKFTMRVGSSDGTMGLKGDIYDTRGRRLLAAMITAFSSGVLNWFSQTIVAQYQDSSDAKTAVTGAALGGISEVGNKIANMYASDLNNAPVIFHARKGIPLILYPEDQ